MDMPYPCSSLNNNVDGILQLAGKTDVYQLDNQHYCNRVVQLPAKSWTLSDILAAATEGAKEQGITMGKVQKVAAASGSTTVKEINVCPHVDCSRAESLGLPMRVDLKDIITDYVHNYVKPPSKL